MTTDTGHSSGIYGEDELLNLVRLAGLSLRNVMSKPGCRDFALFSFSASFAGIIFIDF